MKDFKTTFFFLKLPIAVSLLGHGLVRLPKLPAFTDWLVTTMEKSVIPEFLIVPFGYVLPIAEFLIGLSLLIGFRMKYSLFAGMALMSVLIFGSSSIENWSAIESQLLHSFYLFGSVWFWQKYKPEPTN
jgi:thiosulfate dehydrogenase [quinone] large subunit